MLQTKQQWNPWLEGVLQDTKSKTKQTKNKKIEM